MPRNTAEHFDLWERFSGGYIHAFVPERGLRALPVSRKRESGFAF